MRYKSITAVAAAVCLLAVLSLEARGESAGQLPIESLLGKFDGVIQVENAKPVGHSYQTEITTIDAPANTVSLTASCKDCGTRKWTRKNCEIQERTERIRFICKGPVSDEAYTFDGRGLNAIGFGNNYPYSIHTVKM
jgi:hypothetical protein